MKLLILFFSIAASLFAFAENFSERHKAKLEKLEKITYEDLIHENKGCPENSICSPLVGEKFLEWDQFLKRLIKIPRINRKDKLNPFLKKNGMPLHFLIAENEIKKPLGAYWNSRCRHHNQKDKSKVFKALGHLKSLDMKSNIKFDSATIIETKSNYQLPYQHQPIMIKDNKLIFTVDFDKAFFHLSVTTKGEIEAVNVGAKELQMALDNIQRVPCEKESEPTMWHLEQMCKKIWNATLQTTQIVQMDWSCP